MKMIYLFLLIGGVVLTSCNTNAIYPESKANKHDKDRTTGKAETENVEIDKLLSPNLEERRRAAKCIIKLRSETISRLLEICKLPDGGDKEYFSKKDAAVFLLGELRAGEATGFLTDNIKFTTITQMAHDFSEFNGQLCAEALYRIGIPAAEGIWAKIKHKSLDKDTIKLYSLVLRCIYGKEDLRILIEARLKKKSSDEAKANLKELLDNIGFRR